jgi:hypothetical protein
MRSRIAIGFFAALLAAPLLLAQGRSGMSHGNGFRNHQPTSFTGFAIPGIQPLSVPLSSQRPPIIVHGRGFRNFPSAVPIYYGGYMGYISDSDVAYSPGNYNGYSYGPTATVVMTGADNPRYAPSVREESLERRLDDQAVELERLKRERSTPVASRDSDQSQTEDMQPATILVFKDKRSPELVHNYAIVGSNLFVMGKGHRKIPLSDLDLVATSRANEEAGLEFKMPGTPAPQLKSGLGISR